MSSFHTDYLTVLSNRLVLVGTKPQVDPFDINAERDNDDPSRTVIANPLFASMITNPVTRLDLQKKSKKKRVPTAKVVKFVKLNHGTDFGV